MRGNVDDLGPQQEAMQVPWLQASAEDVAAVDFERPLTGDRAASDCHEISNLYQKAGQAVEEAGEARDTSEARVFTMLWALTSMHFKPQEQNDPFGPKAVFADGTRTAIPSDFRPHVDVIADMALRATNPALRARLSDVAWILDRKRGRLGLAAIAAYTEVAQNTYDYALNPTENATVRREARECLRRALTIGRKVGGSKPEAIAAIDLVKRFRERTLTEGVLASISGFSNLDLDFRVSDPADVGVSIERVLAAISKDTSVYSIVDLWRLAAKAYHLANMEDDKSRCLCGAAEALVGQAEAKHISALQASHLLSNAIAQLHGIPNKKDRRNELRHKLIDVQARVPEEMGVFSQVFDVQEIAEKIQEVFATGTLLEKLLTFASLEAAPDPEKLAGDALRIIQDYPLSSLFPAVDLDHEGKVVHRTQSSRDGSSGFNDATIFRQVAKTEEIRRQLVAFGKLEPARYSINDQHFVTDDLLAELLQFSPFVPADLLGTFCRGFARFFQGDFVSSIYVLTPLLENSLRHVLKSYGHDVTKFDDATEIQEDRTISSLFNQMRRELDSVFTPAITADVERVFLIKPGPCLRHAVSHGLLRDSGPYSTDAIYACWLILQLCLMPLFQSIEALRVALSGSDLVRE